MLSQGPVTRLTPHSHHNWPHYGRSAQLRHSPTMSHTTSPHLQDSPDSSSQLLTVEVRGLQASAPLPQRSNTHENILQSIFLVNRSEPVLHQLDQPDENLLRFNMVEIFTSLHCQIPPPPPISSNFKCQCRPPRLV